MKIDLNKKLHQDNLKAEIYHQFKNRFRHDDVNLVCEYKTIECRFDLIAYDTITNEVFGLIEVRRINAKKEPNFNGSQYRRYSNFGCKLFYISTFEKIIELLDDLETCFLEHHKQTDNVF